MHLGCRHEGDHTSAARLHRIPDATACVVTVHTAEQIISVAAVETPRPARSYGRRPSHGARSAAASGQRQPAVERTVVVDLLRWLVEEPALIQVPMSQPTPSGIYKLLPFGLSNPLLILFIDTGSSRLLNVSHAIQIFIVSQYGWMWLYQRFQSPYVAGRSPVSLLACSPSCSPGGLPASAEHWIMTMDEHERILVRITSSTSLGIGMVLLDSPIATGVRNLCSMKPSPLSRRRCSSRSPGRPRSERKP